MPARTLVLLGLLASAMAHADGCDVAFRQSLVPDARVVESLRPDKPGVARVYAPDGSYFSGAQTLWMKGQLRALDHACAHNDLAEAQRRLLGLEGLLKRPPPG